MIHRVKKYLWDSNVIVCVCTIDHLDFIRLAEQLDAAFCWKTVSILGVEL